MVKYEFRYTPEKGNFMYGRKQCAKMGGDLITVNAGPEDHKYHK